MRWSRAWEGDYALGRDEVRAYWQRQRQELDPYVEPTSSSELPDGRLEVAVHQVVKDKQEAVLFDGPVQHLYTMRDGLLQQMDSAQV